MVESSRQKDPDQAGRAEDNPREAGLASKVLVPSNVLGAKQSLHMFDLVC